MKKGFDRELRDRIVSLAVYVIENKATVRSTAAAFGISKSTVHKDLSKRLFYIDGILFEEVREILDKNKAERHLRGGLATKRKYLARRNGKLHRLSRTDGR